MAMKFRINMVLPLKNPICSQDYDYQDCFLELVRRSQEIGHKVSVFDAIGRLRHSMGWGVQAAAGLTLYIICDVNQDTIPFGLDP